MHTFLDLSHSAPPSQMPDMLSCAPPQRRDRKTASATSSSSSTPSPPSSAPSPDQTTPRRRSFLSHFQSNRVSHSQRHPPVDTLDSAAPSSQSRVSSFWVLVSPIIKIWTLPSIHKTVILGMDECDFFYLTLTLKIKPSHPPTTTHHLISSFELHVVVVYALVAIPIFCFWKRKSLFFWFILFIIYYFILYILKSLRQLSCPGSITTPLGTSASRSAACCRPLSPDPSYTNAVPA